MKMCSNKMLSYYNKYDNISLRGHKQEKKKTKNKKTKNKKHENEGPQNKKTWTLMNGGVETNRNLIPFLPQEKLEE